MSQKPVLFARSLHDNIAYGLGPQSRQEVEAAARRANAHAFIARLSHGYDTGMGLRQLLCHCPLSCFGAPVPPHPEMP